MVLMLILIVLGFPGAILGAIAGSRQSRLQSGMAIGWVGGMLGAGAGFFILQRIELVLPHHVDNDVFGPTRVVDFPPERIWLRIKIAGILAGSAGVGWLFFRSIWGRGDGQVQWLEPRKRANRPRQPKPKISPRTPPADK